MASNPQGIYARLKTEMKDAYYTDNMVQNLANFRTMASAYGLGPGQSTNLSFLEICENLEGNGTISWKKLDVLKEIVKTASKGQIQLLKMINEAERKIQEILSDPGYSFRRESGARTLKVKYPGCPLSRESDAKKRKVKGEDMVVYMKKDAFRVKENDAAFLECDVDPKPKQVVWKKGEATKVRERIIINNSKYFGAGPSSPTLVIKETEKRDEAYYQCTAKGVGIGVTGKPVPLNVDAAEERGNSMHGQSRSHSLAASGTRELHFDGNKKLSPRSQDKHLEPCSSHEDIHQGEQSHTGLARQILISSCHMVFTIINNIDVARLASCIKGAFYGATGEKKRIEKLDFEKKCINVNITIKAANSLSEAPAVCLAEQFKHYILDVGLQLSEGSNEVLKVDEASIKITAEHMPENGLPLVNICPQQGSVQHSKSVILQTYIVSSPPASSIEWFRIEADNLKIAIKINSKKYYGGTELSPSLIIRDVNADDQGWYMCQATNNNGTGCSNKTFVRISSESVREEDDKSGTKVTDVSDIQESARAEDTSETSVFNIKDRQEPARGAEDTSETSVFDIKDRQESARAEDTSETSDFDIKDRQEPARGAEDTSETSVFDIKDRQDPPNQPRAMQVTSADRTAMTISWEPPFENYGSPVTEYIIEKQTDWIEVSTVPANKLYCVADNLIEGTKYRFRVTAVNQYGKGRALESDQTYMAESPYDYGLHKILPTIPIHDYESETSDYESPKPLQTRSYLKSTKRGISDIKDLVPIDVWGRAPSQTEIEKIVTLIDSKFSDLFLELGLPSKTVEEYGQGHPVTFQLRMKALLQCWIDSSQTKATIGRLLTAMMLCQMDWHTAAQIWSAK